MTEELIKSWILGLSHPRPEFNDLPACPFASKAKLTLITCFSIAAIVLNLRQTSLAIGEVLLLKFTLEEPVLDPSLILSEENATLTLRDHIAYLSDPDNPMVVSGYQTTQGFAKIIILQRLSELQAVRPWLEKRGYFKNWTEENLRRIGVEL